MTTTRTTNNHITMNQQFAGNIPSTQRTQWSLEDALRASGMA